jgi:hypothetical protein
MRGEFHRADGLILPNNISLAGAGIVMAAAFNLTPTEWWLALVAGAPALDMTIGDMVEPAIGTNGYARQELTHDAVGWPTIAVSNDQMYVESAAATFAAVGGNFSQSIQRVALLVTDTYNAANVVVALSAPLPTPLLVTPATPLASRQFKYRVYL